MPMAEEMPGGVDSSLPAYLPHPKSTQQVLMASNAM